MGEGMSTGNDRSSVCESRPRSLASDEDLATDRALFLPPSAGGGDSGTPPPVEGEDIQLLWQVVGMLEYHLGQQNRAIERLARYVGYEGDVIEGG